MHMICTIYNPENGLTGIEWSTGGISFRALVVGINIQKSHTEVSWMSEIRVGTNWEPRPALQGTLRVSDETHRDLATMGVAAPNPPFTIGEQTLFEGIFGTATIPAPGTGMYDFAILALIRRLNLIDSTLNLSLA